MKKVAIVIPYHKSKINNEEKISLEIAKKKFFNLNKFLLIPDNIKLKFDTTNFQIKKIDPIYFSTYLKYNDFLINEKFYRIFSDYDYILIYQLDCLFFSTESELKKFMFFDFIGPPHINIKKRRFTGTLNGGFSLRNVNSCIDVLNSKKFNVFNFKYIQIRHFFGRKRIFRLIKFFFSIFIILIFNKIFNKEIKSFSTIFFENFTKYYNEDVFWSLFVNLFKKDFNLPSFEKALSFGFDKDAKIMFELNKRNLPLGCHCWYKDGNYQFWKRYI